MRKNNQVTKHQPNGSEKERKNNNFSTFSISLSGGPVNSSKEKKTLWKKEIIFSQNGESSRQPIEIRETYEKDNKIVDKFRKTSFFGQLKISDFYRNNSVENKEKKREGGQTMLSPMTNTSRNQKLSLSFYLALVIIGLVSLLSVKIFFWLNPRQLTPLLSPSDK